jgi:hypothetical protein
MLLLYALAERGEFEEARELLGRHRFDGSLGPTRWEIGIRDARARLWLAEGDFERAHAEACRAGALREEQGRHNPSWTPWRATAALALAHLGRREEAAAVADAEVARAERFGAPGADRPRAARARRRGGRRTRCAWRCCERALGVIAPCRPCCSACACASSSGSTLAYMGRRLEARARCARRWPTPMPSAPCCWPSAPGASSRRPGCARARRRSRASPR